MKRLLIFILLLSLLCPISLANTYDFRKVMWGMSREEVLNSETAKLGKDELYQIFYDVTVDNKSYTLIYFFDKEKLVGASYVLNDKLDKPNDCIDLYNSLKSQLVKKYGEPDKSDTIWKNEKYKDNPEDYGWAISMGQLEYFTGWKNERTAIALGLDGSNGKSRLSINYYSSKYVDEEKAKNGEGL